MPPRRASSVLPPRAPPPPWPSRRRALGSAAAASCSSFLSLGLGALFGRLDFRFLAAATFAASAFAFSARAFASAAFLAAAAFAAAACFAASGGGGAVTTLPLSGCGDAGVAGPHFCLEPSNCCFCVALRLPAASRLIRKLYIAFSGPVSAMGKNFAQRLLKPKLLPRVRSALKLSRCA